MRYAIGPLRLDPATRTLSRAGEPLALGPRVVATLAALVERAGELVTKDELLDDVWDGEDVGESNVAQSVYVLRKTLREHGIPNAIATVPRRGYRFTAEARPVAERAVARSTWRFAAAAFLALALLPASSAPPVVTPLGARGAELYRLGRYFWAQRTPVGLSRGANLFREVVRSDPRSALGYSGLADAVLMQADYGRANADRRRRYAEARAAALEALRLDPGSAEAHTSFGMVLALADCDARDAETEFRRALALDPSYALAHHWYGTLLLRGNRLAEGSRELRRAVALEPAAPATNAWLAAASYDERRYDDVLAYARRALAVDPDRVDALRVAGLAYEERGDFARAAAAFRAMKRHPAAAGSASALLAELYAREGRRAAARAELRIALRVVPREADTRFAELAFGSGKAAAHILAAARAEDPHDPRLARYAEG